MIRFLSVENLAVVERLELELQPGLTVLTGETGAGKSVLIGALDLLFGGRGATNLVRTGTELARVQAVVDVEGGREITVRRDLTAQGRSRAFINGALATLTDLQEQGRYVIDLHGQHEHQALLNASSHLGLLDAFGRAQGTIPDGESVRAAFLEWRSVRRKLSDIRSQVRDRSERQQMLSFERDEIQNVSPVAGEDEALAATRTRLANAERLTQLSTETYRTLYERDDSVLGALGQVWRQVEELAQLDNRFVPFMATRSEVESGLEDLAFFLRSYAASLDSASDELDNVESRLSALERLKHRYGPTLADVLQRLEAIEGQLEILESGDAEIRRLQVDEQARRRAYVEAATTLSEARHETAPALARAMETTLDKIGIPRALFEVRFRDDATVAETSWSESGIDDVEFFFSANPGESPRRLAKVASGGELSRVMLSLKTLATTDRPGKTLVFDEIDAGIGGVVSDRVGAMLRELSERYQIVCVTHLPQIAAYGAVHHRVVKTVRLGRTVVAVEQLDENDRAVELARLMTGTTTESARSSARELLSSRREAKGESQRRTRRKRKAKAKGES